MSDLPEEKTPSRTLPIKHIAQGVFLWVAMVAVFVGAFLLWGQTPLRKAYEARLPRIVADIVVQAAPTSVTPTPQHLIPLAIIVTRLGLSDSLVTQALERLPETVGLAFYPYKETYAHMVKAAAHQRPIFGMLMMEPEQYPVQDPGDGALSGRVSQDENKKRLENMLAGKTIQGVVTFMGSAFLKEESNTAFLVDALKTYNVSFIVEPSTVAANTTPVLERASQMAGLTYVHAEPALNTTQEEKMRDFFFQLEQKAKNKGSALGVIEPYPLAFHILSAWEKTLTERGFALVSPLDLPPPNTTADINTIEKTETVPHE